MLDFSSKIIAKKALEYYAGFNILINILIFNYCALRCDAGIMSVYDKIVIQYQKIE